MGGFVVDPGRSVTALTDIRAELRVVHTWHLDDRRVRREIRASSAIALAIQHGVGAPGDAQDGHSPIAQFHVAVGREEQQPDGSLLVPCDVATGHRASEGVLADDPPVDLRVAGNDSLGSVRIEHRQVERHFGEIDRDVGSANQ